MWDFIRNGFKSFTKSFQGFFLSSADKASDDDSGKAKGLNHVQLRKIALISVIVLVASILVLRFYDQEAFVFGGKESFEKENNPDIGVSDSRSRNADEFSGLENGNISNRDVLSRLNNLQPTDRDILDVSGVAGLDENGNVIPDIEECQRLLTKLQEGLGLTPEEKEKLKLCVEKNEDFRRLLDPTKLAALKKLLNDEELTEAEKQALIGLLTDELYAGTDKEAAAKALLNLDKEKDAKAYFKALQDGKDALAKALAKKIKGEPLTDEEKRLIAEAYNRANPQAELTDTEALAELAESVAAREAALKALRDQLAQAQARAKGALDKLANGASYDSLTDEEKRALDEYNKLREKLDALQKEQDAEKARLAALYNKRNKENAQVASLLKDVFGEEGMGVAYTDLDCTKFAKLPYKKYKKKKKRKYRVVKEKKFVDENGKSIAITPEEISWLQLQADKKAKIAQLQKDILDDDGDILSGEKRIDASKLVAEGGTIDISNAIAFELSQIKTFGLTPDTKIPAVLETQILVSDKGQGQRVIVTIIDDITSPQTNKIVIPKGSKITGFMGGGSFDPATGVADFSFDKVSIGTGQVIDAKFTVGSADGSFGLKGLVGSNTGELLAGTFIASFSAGALNFFSQSVVQPFLDDEDNAGAALTGAAGQGAAEVLTRVAEIYAERLQNAAQIFYVPKGIPIILYPN